MNSPLNLLNLATRAAARAAAFLRTVPVPDDPARWTVKGRSDFVTEVDREAEAIIREELATESLAPVLGEELSPDQRPTGPHWIVDPLDGTTNFLHRYPAWAVSIAAVDGDDVLAGVIHRPEDDRVSTAARGHGAWENGRPLRVSRVEDPRFALIGTGFPFKHPEALGEYQQQFASVLLATSGVRRAGSAALDLADVAAGRFDGFWELHLAPWDMAAGLLLIREAGGVVTDGEGEERTPGHGAVVAGNPVIHRWLLDTIRTGAEATPEGGSGSAAPRR